MKHRVWSILAVLILLLMLLVLPVQASEYRFVFDDAVLLTASKAAQLEEIAGDLSLHYNCGVYIVTVYDYQAYGSNVRAAAENFFLEHELGFGSDASGVLLMLSMAQRDYALIAHGNIGNTAFTDYGKEIISEEFLDNFRYDDWAGGFSDYLSFSEKLLEAAATGMPVDIEQGSGVGVTLLMVLMIPAAIAGIACGIMAASMKSARTKTHAGDYQSGVELTERSDRFITRTVVRHKIESSSSSGGTKINSGGFSGRSGKF